MAKNKENLYKWDTLTVVKMKFPIIYYSGIVYTCAITQLIFT